ncbi:hypothetical protein AAFX91_00265 [Bradyrhizobium sp. 31Argb]|uniref:hypothetical protein n=1 Tax=Bradyrhizobium sp. 31Argb TaxID=3141247 RepID=UPI0037485804
MTEAPISAISFFDGLNWIDGRPLVIEDYRKDIFHKAFDTYRDDGIPQYSMVLAGRSKKNFKSADLVLGGLYSLTCRESPQGSDVLLVGNDEDQAAADLDLAKKIIAANPELGEGLEVLAKEIRRKDNRGVMRVIPAQNVIGQHGRTAVFVGFDEIHGYRNWDLLEALAPDPTRTDTLTWITSYDSIYDLEGCPLHDLKKIGMEGSDPRMLFSWYSADYCTDPNFAHLPPDERANPSMASWPEGRGYIEQQRRRLPSARFRRLHHNLPGAPQGAHFDQGRVEAAIVSGRQVIEPQDGVDYLAFVDMSGGSSDDATLAIAHWDDRKAVLHLLINQGQPTPFNPRDAVKRFAVMCKLYRCKVVHGDAYAGETFRRDFADCGIDYIVDKRTRTDIYESLEVALNAGQAEMLDIPELRRQLLTLVRKGATIDHQSGQHDDWATSAAGALTLANPDIGNPEPAILTHYRKLSEAVDKERAAPQAEQEQQHPEPGALRRADGRAKLKLVTAVSHLITASGETIAVESDADGTFYVWVSESDARHMLSPYNQPLLEANEELRQMLGPNPPQPQGIRIASILEAQRPQTRKEYFESVMRRRIAGANEVVEIMRRKGRWHG